MHLYKYAICTQKNPLYNNFLYYKLYLVVWNLCNSIVHVHLTSHMKGIRRL